MLKEIIFSAFSLASSLWLVSTIFCLVPFFSSQSQPENKYDASTLTLFTMDVCLVVLFMCQHSLLATRTYNNVMEKFGLRPVARSMYVLTTVLALQVLMTWWQPITEVRFWMLDTQESRLTWLFFHLLHWLFWAVIFLQCLVMEPCFMIGVKQVYYYVKGLYHPTYNFHPRFHQILSHMPHPGSGSFIAVLWIHPYMTFDRMILATVLTAYLCCSYSVSEKDYCFMKSYCETTEVKKTTQKTYKAY